MACYDRETLSRYQDGSLSEAEGRRIAAHLDACAGCRGTFAALGRAGLYLRLTVGSRRTAECPTDEEMGAYLAGVMRAEDRDRIELHLAECRICLHEVAAMSDEGMLTPGEEGPEPDARAMARFAALVPSASRARRRPALTTWLGRVGVAAALIAAAVVAGWLLPGRDATETPVESSAATLSADGRPMRYVTEASFAPTDGWAIPSGGAELGRFARESGSVLREIERLLQNPRRQTFELAREDLLNSGLLERVAPLREFAREERDRRFLNDCEYVFLQVVKAEAGDLETPDGDLSRIVSEIRRLKLIETARLVEMEGSKSQWLAGL